MQPDSAPNSLLLDEFVRHGSQNAFAEIVRRYADFVLATAQRRLGTNRHMAEDVMQAVFIVLARRAATLTAGTLLPGWLHRTTCYAAANAMRVEGRRKLHEQRFAAERGSADRGAPGSEHGHSGWDEIRCHLDDALDRLAESDRNALLLRYFNNHSVEQTGVAMGLSHEAVKKRLQRALDRLRTVMARSGVKVPAATIASALTAHATPASVLSSAGLANAAAAATCSPGALSATFPQLIAKGTLTMMTVNQIKVVVAWTLAAVAMLGGTALIVPQLLPASLAAGEMHAAQPPATQSTSPPQTASPPVEAMRFGAIVEISVNDDGVGNDECLDFDTGRTLTAPRRFADRAEGEKWFRDSGADLHAETETGAAGIYAMGLAVVPVDAERFDLIEPIELQSEMDEARPRLAVISADDPLPVTFQFRTREGGIGIGQIIAMDRGPNEHGSLKIRYKLLVSPK